jgi:hypothetical protein
MNNESQKKQCYVKIILEKFRELGPEKFVSLFCEGLSERKTIYNMDYLINYPEWIKVPGIAEKNLDIKEITENLYRMCWKECTSKIGARTTDKDIVEMQAEFLKKYGTSIPDVVWAYVLADRLYPESLLLDTPDMELKPNFAIVNRILSPPAMQMERKILGREQIEKKLMGLSQPGNKQVFIDSFCKAIEAQPGSITRDFEQLLNPCDWENLQDDVHKEENEDDMYAKGEWLQGQYNEELAKFQLEFLKKHGAEIPYFVLPKTLAYEAMKEETEGGGNTTQILKTMGIDY